MKKLLVIILGILIIIFIIIKAIATEPPQFLPNANLNEPTKEKPLSLKELIIGSTASSSQKNLKKASTTIDNM